MRGRHAVSNVLDHGRLDISAHPFCGGTPDDVGAPYLARNLGRHGLKTTIDAIDPGAVSGRARGRALLDYTHGKGADLLVMGAYGRGQVMSFLGLGGATGKVISSCRVPLLLAH